MSDIIEASLLESLLTNINNCFHCNNIFATKASLQRHIKTQHSGIKPIRKEYTKMDNKKRKLHEELENASKYLKEIKQYQTSPDIIK